MFMPKMWTTKRKVLEYITVQWLPLELCGGRELSLISVRFNCIHNLIYIFMQKYQSTTIRAVGVKRNLISGRPKSDPLSPKENIISALNRESS